MTVLRGPTDADHFRVKVGRYGDRWYTDPLPECTIADASDWHGPSVSATKPPFANKYVPMRAIADMPSDDWERLAGKDADTRYEAIKTHDKLASQINMKRGGIVHEWAEDLLFGNPLRDPINWATTDTEHHAAEQAQRFIPALQSFFDTHQPELVACEVVGIHRSLNGVGYGGTSDAYIKVEGDIWCVDWKSRHSDHAAYPDEAGQGGAYIGAEYMIIVGPDGNPMRAPIPDVAGVLIVSIREDGFRVYPIDADGAIKHYEAMHRWWVAQQNLTANKVIGRPWAPKVAAPISPAEQPSAGETPVTSPADKNSDSTAGSGSDTSGAQAPGSGSTRDRPAPAPSDRRAALLARYQAMSDDEKIAFVDEGAPKDDLDAIERALNAVDRFNAHVDMPPIKEHHSEPVMTPPDEGAAIDEADVMALSTRFAKLPKEGKEWTGTLVTQGKDSYDWRIKGRPTVRRYELYRGVLALAEWGTRGGSMDGLDDVVRAIVYQTIGNRENMSPGQALGLLNYADAKEFARYVHDVTTDRLVLLGDDTTGTLRLTTTGVTA